MTGEYPPIDHGARRRALAAQFEDAGIELAICWQQPTVCYLTGNDISGSNALVWSAAQDWLVFCDEYDAYNFANSAQDLVRITYPYTRSLWGAIGEWLGRHSHQVRTIGVEHAEIRHVAWEMLAHAVPRVRPVSIDDHVAAVRLPKSAPEIARIRAAARCVELAVGAAQAELRSRTSERELGAVLYGSLIRAGSDYVASQPYIKSGERALLTHARWADRMIDPGDHVFVELGASVERYHASIMRTRLASDQSPQYQRAVDAVIAGRDAYLEALRPGITAEELHEAHLRVLDRFEMRPWSRHAGGYSLGIAFPPYWGEVPLLTITGGVRRRLEAPMAFHLISGVLEPEAAVPHIGLSECVLLTERGVERLVEVPDFL